MISLTNVNVKNLMVGIDIEDCDTHNQIYLRRNKMRNSILTMVMVMVMVMTITMTITHVKCIYIKLFGGFSIKTH